MSGATGPVVPRGFDTNRARRFSTLQGRSRWFHHFHCEKVCNACIQELANVEAANIGFACQQLGDHRVAVPLDYMPAHLRSALSHETRVDAKGYLVDDTFGTDAQASSSSSESHLSSSGTSSNGPNMILRLREKTQEVNRMIRDSSDLWSRVSPYGSVGAEMDIYRHAQFTLPPTPEILGQISGSVQAAIRASEARGGRGEMKAPSPVPRPSMSREELYARGLADSWVQK
ncbi:hypothetical protein JMJ77_0000066 [Colletotrichum scovillei]|uniref:Uncharacterized protein n=1 Tax=Colletotrichum scovillei TaxID=1209932 RepID=A0A9P7UGZ1_9PEZI|nr:hypothetical protein JMJ77_0000066 [Colletotrichum scovillei]KAG7071264.1 hypothetical protein JMJ76_0004138 [Colletotrichum scovillei]KAG7079489.1 hypothetical protein JMJ78_0006597 [Colletotrichum scovillei]